MDDNSASKSDHQNNNDKTTLSPTQHYLMTLPLVILVAAISSAPEHASPKSLAPEVLAWISLGFSAAMGFFTRFLELQGLNLENKLYFLQMDNRIEIDQKNTEIIINYRKNVQALKEEISKNYANRFFSPLSHILLLTMGTLLFVIARAINLYATACNN